MGLSECWLHQFNSSRAFRSQPRGWQRSLSAVCFFCYAYGPPCLQLSTYYKFTECPKLRGLATSSNMCFDAAMDLAQNACGYPVAAAAPPCPKEASLREFQWYGPTWHSLYTSLWELVARKILWKYTPDCTRAFCVDSENIEISWKFLPVWDSMPMPTVPVSSSSVQQAFHQQASAELMDQEAVQDILPNKVLLHPAHSRTRARTRVAEFISFQVSGARNWLSSAGMRMDRTRPSNMSLVAEKMAWQRIGWPSAIFQCPVQGGWSGYPGIGHTCLHVSDD